MQSNPIDGFPQKNYINYEKKKQIEMKLRNE